MNTTLTMKDIAAMLNVSISTVSKALNDRNYISTETRLRIVELAKANNYTPNNLACALRKKKNNTIAVIVPEIRLSYFGNLISEIQEKAFKKRYKLLLMQSYNCPEKELECISMIRHGCVDGIILIRQIKTPKNSLSKLKLVIETSLIPIVIQEIDKLEMDKVYTNSEDSLNSLLYKISII
jgi:LacI family transcriptional regulator